MRLNSRSPVLLSTAVGHIIRYGFYTTRAGKRLRYQCQTCGKTFCSTLRTPYYRLQHRRATFDEVVSLSVEGLNKSAIARVKRIAWARWKERLEDQLELLRCHYNFVRPHRALKFGREVRTPAPQAGLTSRAPTSREIFSSKELFVASTKVIFALFETARPIGVPIRGVRVAA